MHIALLYQPSTTPLLLSVYQLRCTLLYNTYFVNVNLLTGIYVDMAGVIVLSIVIKLLPVVHAHRLNRGVWEMPAPPHRYELKLDHE